MAATAIYCAAGGGPEYRAPDWLYWLAVLLGAACAVAQCAG